MDLNSTSTSHFDPRILSSNINNVFPYKVCINLARRAERWQQMQTKFERHGLESVQRFAAIEGLAAILPANWKGSPGAFGCLLSHLAVVSEAKRRGMPSVLIFEDDAALDPNLQTRFSEYFKQIPGDWDMLHFGAMHMDTPVKISENVVRIRSANSTFAYALNHTIFDSFIELNSNQERAVDLNNRLLQSEHNCYCFTPHLAWVEDDSSDVNERQKYHWYLRESLVLHGSGMHELLTQTAVIIAYQNRSHSDSSLQNLLFLTQFYKERLPGTSVLIVEQDTAASQLPSLLPEGTQHLFLRVDGPLNRPLCYNAGMKLSPEKRFLIFSNSDIFVEEWDIRANLRMCERYDGATGFKSLIRLTDTATRQLQSNQPMLLTPWFDAAEYARCDKNGFEKFSVFNRRSLEAVGGWDDQSPTDIEFALKTSSSLRIFSSPNDGLQLLHD